MWAGYTESKCRPFGIRTLCTTSEQTKSLGVDYKGFTFGPRHALPMYMNQLFTDQWHYHGKWDGMSLGDSQIWLGPEAVDAFHEVFGFWKGNANVFVGAGTQTACHSYSRCAVFEEIELFVEAWIARDAMSLLNVLEGYRRQADEYQAGCREWLSSAPSSMSNSELAALFRRIRRLQFSISRYDQFGIFTEDFFERRVGQILLPHIADEMEYQQTIDALILPHELPTMRLEEKALLESLLALVDSDKLPPGAPPRQVRLALVRHARNTSQKLSEQYGWQRVFLRNIGHTADHYLSELTDLATGHEDLREHLLTRLRYLEQLPFQRRSDSRSIVERLGLNKEEQTVIAIYRALTEARNEASTQVGLGSLIVNPIVTEGCKRLGIDENIFHLLCVEEFAELLDGSRQIAQLDIDGRSRICGFWFQNERTFHLMRDDEAQRFLESQQDAHRATEAPILSQPHKGTCAAAGLAEGIACIVSDVDDLNKFKEGMILVAENTTVDYVPVLRKSAGIITEHGGRTCHAAVVAREFGVPAIVNYPQATHIFRDGQTLRFDTAEGGIVHIISRLDTGQQK